MPASGPGLALNLFFFDQTPAWRVQVTCPPEILLVPTLILHDGHQCLMLAVTQVHLKITATKVIPRTPNKLYPTSRINVTYM